MIHTTYQRGRIVRFGALGAAAAPEPGAAPVANTLPSKDTDVTFYPSPGNLETYYRDIHTYMLKLNDLIAMAKGRPCFTATDLELWRAFRDSWVAFYSEGPSQWFTWLKDDVSRGQAFHSRALQWEAFVVGRCGVQPLPATARPMGTPSTFADSITGLFASVTGVLADAASGAAKGVVTGLSKSGQQTLIVVGAGALGLLALYIGFRVWRG